MIILTSSIDASIKAGIESALRFDSNVIVVRAVNEKDLYIDYTKIPEYYCSPEEQEDPPECTYEEVKHEKFVIKCKYQDYLDKAAIIVGTVSRLKEGFNCKNITTGICSCFPWSVITRIQILGRIRRKSEDDELNKHRRLFMVNSHRIPSDLSNPRRRIKKITILYDEDYEKKLFKLENYTKIYETEEAKLDNE